MHLNDLREKEIEALTTQANDLQIENPSNLKKHELHFFNKFYFEKILEDQTFFGHKSTLVVPRKII